MRKAALIKSEAPRAEALSPAASAVTRLMLTDFRSYPSLRISAGLDPVVLFGANGAGKTNMLEALSLLVPGRGLRRARQADLLRFGAAANACWAVNAAVATPKGEISIGTGRDPRALARDDEDAGDEDFAGSERRVVRIDGQPARKTGALSDVLRAVWLTPEMDGLFRDGASGRRRFIDRAVVGMDRSHATRLNAYERSLRERARLLKAGGADAQWLDALEDRMACDGVAVAAARAHTAERLCAVASEGFGPFPGAVLSMEGSIERSLAQFPALEAEARLREDLARSRLDDAFTGGAAYGPHRSDLAVRHYTKNLPAELCSTGEQKALMIALVLAIAALQARDLGTAPLLLLDEVAAHLDPLRRSALFERMAEIGAQVWLTGTERESFSELEGRAQYFRVGSGAAVPA